MWVLHPDVGPEPKEMHCEKGDGQDWYSPDLDRVMLEGVHVFKTKAEAVAEAKSLADIAAIQHMVAVMEEDE